MLGDLAPLVDLMREGRKDASVTRRVINFWKGRSNATDGKVHIIQVPIHRNIGFSVVLLTRGR